jgi:hypothetical protein
MIQSEHRFNDLDKRESGHALEALFFVLDKSVAYDLDNESLKLTQWKNVEIFDSYFSKKVLPK